WRAMTNFFSQAGPGDISMVMGLKNLPLASHDSIEMTLVFALAENLDSLRQTMDAVRAIWNAPAAVWTVNATPNISLYPNPFANDLHISWPFIGAARVSIVDALGREIAARDAVS